MGTTPDIGFIGMNALVSALLDLEVVDEVSVSSVTTV